MNEEMITGYQVMVDGSYGGTYEFPNNKDKEEIHWPPNVVEIGPPEVSDGEQAFWNGEGWSLRPNLQFDGDNTLIEPGSVRPYKNPRILTEEERLQFLPFPRGIPQKDANGNFPNTRLNADKTAWEWFYPIGESE